MTTPDQLRHRAQYQSAAIESSDSALSFAELPTFTETILALDALIRATEPDDIVRARNAAIDIVMRATGTPEAIPQFWIQQYGRALRPQDPLKLALEVCPAAKIERLARDHVWIYVPAAELDAVRAYVEPRRVVGMIVNYLPLETDK